MTMTSSRNNKNLLKTSDSHMMQSLLEQHHDKEKLPDQPPFLDTFSYKDCKRLFAEGKDVSIYIDHKAIDAEKRTNKAKIL